MLICAYSDGSHGLQQEQLGRSCFVQLQRDAVHLGEQSPDPQAGSCKTRQPVFTAFPTARQHPGQIRV